MAVTNNLKAQVDLPVWEWARFAPAVSSALSSSCAADNSTFTVQHGRYIYYLIAATSFWRYDTIYDSYQQLASPQVAPATPFSSMSFAGAAGYYGRVIGAPSSTTIQAATLTGALFKDFDIRIIGGSGAGQQRKVTAVADVVISDTGTATAGATTSLTDTTKNWQVNQWVGYQLKIVLSTGAIQTRKILYNTATVITFSDTNKYPEDVWCNSPAVASAAGSAYQIESSVLTVDSAFATTLDSTSRFVIQTGGIWLASSQAVSMYSLQYYDIAADQWYIRTANTGPIATIGLDGSIQRFGENASIFDRGIALGTHSTTTLQDTTKSWTVNEYAGYYVRIISGTGIGQLRVIASNTSNTLTWSSAGTAPDNTSYYSIEGFDAGTATSSTVASGTASSTTGSISGNILTVGATITGAFKQGMILSGTGVSPLYTATNGTSAGAVVTVGSTTGIYVGMVMTMVSGTGALAAGVTTVISVNNSTTFTVSQTPTTPLSGTNVFVLGGTNTIYTSAAGATSSSTTVTVGSTTSLTVGMGVIVTTGTGTFVPGTTVTAINSATTFTVSVAPSVALSGGASIVVGVYPLVAYIDQQLTGTTGDAGTYRIFPAQITASTTITGTGIASLTDSSKSWAASRWNGMMVRITGGTGVGQTRSIIGTTSNTLILARDWMIAPDATSTYVIHGDIDKIIFSIGIASPGTSSLFIQNLDADTMTLGRALDFGASRGFSAQLLNGGQSYGDTLAVACTTGAYTAPGGTTATTAGSVSGTQVTVTFSTTTFAVGSFVTVAGCTPAAYNGTYRVQASFSGSVTYTPTTTPGGVITVQGTIGQAASLLVTTVNPHNFITDQTVGLRGDTGTGAAVNNLAAGYKLFVNSTTTFTVGLPSTSAAVTVPAQSTTRLVDASKNWVVNQWAGCVVTYNTAAVAAATGIAAETSMQIAGNDSNSLYFIAAAAAAPTQGISRYVITPPSYSALKNMLGVLDSGLSIGTNSTTTLQDATKAWTSNATSCSSTGTTLITTTGSTAGLQVGMNVGVSAGTGTFVVGAVAGTYTPLTVTAINSATTFTVSAVPATNLSAATVIATQWFPGKFVNRKVKIIAGTGLGQELTITANTANTLTFAVATQPLTGQSTYAILSAAGKGTGINLNWNFGQSNLAVRGSHIYVARGNALVGIDRFNMQTDTWDLNQNSPGFETLSTGSMYAYDGVDRIYFTKDITQRVYYYDISKNTVHVAGMFPYVAGTAITGNRMETFQTVDGLQYLWLNRHSNVECFKLLLAF